jgi:hypothetical protein
VIRVQRGARVVVEPPGLLEALVGLELPQRGAGLRADLAVRRADLVAHVAQLLLRGTHVGRRAVVAHVLVRECRGRQGAGKNEYRCRSEPHHMSSSGSSVKACNVDASKAALRRCRESASLSARRRRCRMIDALHQKARL